VLLGSRFYVGVAVSNYRNQLPQLSEAVFVTDSGLETDLIFNHGFDLPDFASFVLLDDESGVEALQNYVAEHAELAADSGVGVIIETPTWRASSDWGSKLGYDDASLSEVNRRAVELLAGVRALRKPDSPPMVVSGNIGPRGDGYSPTSLMSADEARAYHSSQIDTFADTDVDMVTALTMTYVDEALGVAQAAAAAGVPSAIGFTVETDGRLPDGTQLTDAIDSVDAASDGAPAYYLVNCAHPTHLSDSFGAAAATGRLRGFRANASSMSHEELDNSEVLDDGNPTELGQQFRKLRASSPNLTILGGCCGTDARHIRAIAEAING